MPFRIRPTTGEDQQWICRFIRDRWLADFVVAHGVVYYPHTLGGFLAETEEGSPVGLATYAIENSACELVTLDSLREGEGVGTGLIQRVSQEACRSRCSRLWCVTTNDNLSALRFYQKRGFRIVAVRPGAVERSRVLKPSIPLLGIEGIPIRDEIELEFPLSPT